MDSPNVAHKAPQPDEVLRFIVEQERLTKTLKHFDMTKDDLQGLLFSTAKKGTTKATKASAAKTAKAAKKQAVAPKAKAPKPAKASKPVVQEEAKKSKSAAEATKKAKATKATKSSKAPKATAKATSKPAVKAKSTAKTATKSKSTQKSDKAQTTAKAAKAAPAKGTKKAAKAAPAKVVPAKEKAPKAAPAKAVKAKATKPAKPAPAKEKAVKAAPAKATKEKAAAPKAAPPKAAKAAKAIPTKEKAAKAAPVAPAKAATKPAAKPTAKEAVKDTPKVPAPAVRGPAKATKEATPGDKATVAAEAKPRKTPKRQSSPRGRKSANFEPEHYIYQRLLIYTDGAARGNPGESGAGVVLKTPEGEEVGRFGKYLGRHTNNYAEYQALLLGLHHAKEFGATDITILSDSELLVRQLLGEYRVRAAHLRELYDEAKELLLLFDKYQIKRIGREKNTEADSMANRAIDEKL